VALPDNITTVWITGQIVGARGRVTFQPSPEGLNDPAARQSVATAAPYVAVLASDGSFAVQVPATNDPDVQPSGWTYEVRTPLGRAFPMQVPSDAPVLNEPGHPLHGERVLFFSDVVPVPGPNAGSVQVITPPAASPEDIAAAVEGYLTDNPPGTDPALTARVDELDMEQDAHHVRLNALESSSDDLGDRLAAIEAAGALAPYTHTQNAAQSVWTVAHGLGRYPVAWSLFDATGVLCGGYLVQHLDQDTTRVSMDIPTAGLLRLI
jgi:hypothetical protein